ncbi:MAG: CRTAC1 family protein [Myxococcota bacterium]
MRRASLLVLFFVPSAAMAGPGTVTHRDIVPDDAGLSAYRNTTTPRRDQLNRFIGRGVLFNGEFLDRPDHPNGSPGVGLFDFDNDGDLDIFLPNGTEAGNSLFKNLLSETGELNFVDVAAEAGVLGPTEHEGSAVTTADLDNDGDQDVLITGYSTENLVYENLGNGTFRDITESSGLKGAPDLGASGACVGDLNGDGLLDVFISHSYDHQSMRAIFTDQRDVPIHNALYFNRGGLHFEDVSQSSGILVTRGHIDAGGNEFIGDPGATHVCAIYDRDFDGDLDILYGDDQGAVPPRRLGGIDRGNIHLFENDGSGFFTDISVEVGVNFTGSWMGVSVADFNGDGYLDFFMSNLGDAPFSLVVGEPRPGEQASRWFFDGPDGFRDSLNPDGTSPGVISSEFGWGVSSYDYDNDGDTDILYHGDLDIGPFYTISNPGYLLINDGAANFTADTETFRDSADHLHRIVFGVATGDLDGDGFEDIVTASAVNVDPADTLPNPFDFGGPFDPIDAFIPTFSTMPPGGDPLTEPLFFNPTIQSYADGDVAVEINNGENGNGSANVKLVGTHGLLRDGCAPRDGIGATVTFRTRKGKTVRYPIAVGDSYASSNSKLAHFGLGDSKRGTLDVMWPGGVKNRLYNIRHRGEPYVMPEIPCSIDTDDRFFTYATCVARSLKTLRKNGTVTNRQAFRLKASAFRAYFEERRRR